MKFDNEECGLIRSFKGMSGVEVKILAAKLVDNIVFHFIELVGGRSILSKVLDSLKKSRDLRVIGYRRGGRRAVAIVSTEACSACKIFY